MSPELPPALRAALDRRLDGISRKALNARAARVSKTYRAGGSSAQVIASLEDALAYALARMPATFAACAAVFAQAARAAPQFAPVRLLDAGVGSGAASWAAASAWPGLRQATWIDASLPFLQLAQALAVEAAPPLRAPAVLRADLATRRDWPKADLVVASYALAELPSEAQAPALTALWAACDGLLALIEPGTPAGFARIVAARERLITTGAEILAPCTHARGCPIVAPDWCHFAVRLARSRDHRLAKGAEAPFEDEKFAYLLAARPGLALGTRAARIVAAPRANKAGVSLKLCGPQGLELRHVPSREKAAHAAVRRLGWGDLLAR